jgi:prophage antirepressor-like protein
MDNTTIVGFIHFDDHKLDVYSSLDEPIFKASDVANLVDYSNNTWKLLELCEADEKLNLPMVVAGQVRKVSFVTEQGLYNILSQSRKPIARKWRKIIGQELINLRKSRQKNVVEQFDDWNDQLNSIFYDPDTGKMMRSVTVQGGDVEQVPVED